MLIKKNLDVFKPTDIFISIIIYFAVLKNTEKIKNKFNRNVKIKTNLCLCFHCYGLKVKSNP